VDSLSHTIHTRKHTSRQRCLFISHERSSPRTFTDRISTISHLVWGRVVPDIPDFCRELVAALAEE
jgi:hypothetical protein